MDTDDQSKTLEERYRSIQDNESYYLRKRKKWSLLGKLSLSLLVIGFIIFFIYVGFFQPSFLYTMEFSVMKVDYTLHYYAFFSSLWILFILFLMFFFSLIKTSQIQSELGLSNDELIFLKSYDTYNYIKNYFDENKPSRKLYYKKLILENAISIKRLINKWTYGNIDMIKKIYGEQINLLKNNFSRLIISNIAKGEENTSTLIQEIFYNLAEFIYDQNLEKIKMINKSIEELPYIEYKILNTKERLNLFIRSNVLLCRIIFSTSIVLVIILLGNYLQLHVGYLFATTITCFWGAFAGFDKIFNISD